MRRIFRPFIKKSRRFRSPRSFQGEQKLFETSPTSSLDFAHQHQIFQHKPILNKIVILIGCEYIQYNKEGLVDRLPGCHMDIKMIQKMLMEHYSYNVNQFIILSDENDTLLQPTRENILYTLTQATQRTDLARIIIYYSGHGIRLKHNHDHTPKNNYDAALLNYISNLSKIDGCIVPCDFITAGFVRDTIFHSDFWIKIPIWTRVTAIFDCCNSGTIFDLPFRYTGHNKLQKCHNTTQEKMSSVLPMVISISGCKEDQQSASVFDTSQHPDWEGCLSYVFRQVLKSHHYGPVGINIVMDELCTMMKKLNYIQIPQLGLSRDVMPSSIIDIF